MPFLDDSERDDVLLSVKLELIELIDADQQQQVPTEPEPSELPVKKSKLTKLFEGIIILPQLSARIQHCWQAARLCCCMLDIHRHTCLGR